MKRNLIFTFGTHLDVLDGETIGAIKGKATRYCTVRGFQPVLDGSSDRGRKQDWVDSPDGIFVRQFVDEHGRQRWAKLKPFS